MGCTQRGCNQKVLSQFVLLGLKIFQFTKLQPENFLLLGRQKDLLEGFSEGCLKDFPIGRIDQDKDLLVRAD